MRHTHLRSCATCARHIRVTEATCPFCSAPVPIDRRSPPPFGTPPARLRRAFAFSAMAATGTVSASSSCSSAVEPPVITGADAYGGVELDAGRDVSSVVTGGDAYGAVQFDAGPDVNPVVSGGDAYGLAPLVDAAADAVPTGDAEGGLEPVEAGDDGAQEDKDGADNDSGQ